MPNIKRLDYSMFDNMIKEKLDGKMFELTKFDNVDAIILHMLVMQYK